MQEERFVTISDVLGRISVGRRNRWRRKNNALFVDSCTSLCRQFAKIELSAERSDLSLRGLRQASALRSLYLRDEKSFQQRGRNNKRDRIELRRTTSNEIFLVVSRVKIRFISAETLRIPLLRFVSRRRRQLLIGLSRREIVLADMIYSGKN